MIFVPHFAGRQCLKSHVVLDVWCRHHNRLRARKFKEDSLECRQTRRVLMLDHFHHRRGIVTQQDVCPGRSAIHESVGYAPFASSANSPCAVSERQSPTHGVTRPSQQFPRRSCLSEVRAEVAPRHNRGQVRASHRASKRCHHGTNPLLGQADRFFDGLLFARIRFSDFITSWFLVSDQTIRASRASFFWCFK